MIKSAKYANVYAEGYLTLWPAGKNSTPPLVPFPQHNMRFGAYISSKAVTAQWSKIQKVLPCI